MWTSIDVNTMNGSSVTSGEKIKGGWNGKKKTEKWLRIGRGAHVLAPCEHPRHHIDGGTYSCRTEMGKIVWDIVFNADHAPDVFCQYNVLNRLGEIVFEVSYLSAGVLRWPCLYRTMLKFRPYHRLWCFNQNPPMTFHFLMHSTSRFHLFIRSLRKSWSEKKPPHELKFRSYHKCWIFNEKLPMTFNFCWCTKICNKILNLSTKTCGKDRAIS